MLEAEKLEFIKSHIARLENPFNANTKQEYGWVFLMGQILEILAASEYVGA